LAGEAFPGQKLAYFEHSQITDVKSFMSLGLGVNVTLPSSLMLLPARYLSGDKLKVVWAEFSTLSWTVLLNSNMSVSCIHAAFSIVEVSPGFALLAEVGSCLVSLFKSKASCNQSGLPVRVMASHKKRVIVHKKSSLIL
jgi:hypothetical protein